MPYRFLEEEATADLAFEAWGRDLPEVFRDAADAVTHAMVEDLAAVEPRERRALALEDDALDLLLFAFLQRLVYYKDAELLLLRVPDVAVEEAGGRWHVRAQAVGEVLDPARHAQGVDVKAVTLHRFRLEPTADGWQAFVILDV